MMVEFAEEPDRKPTAVEEAHFWLVTSTMRRAQGKGQVAMPEVVLDGIIKLLSPPGYLTSADITNNPVVHAAYASIGHALYGWSPEKAEEHTNG
jgi:hypothetical protein